MPAVRGRDVTMARRPNPAKIEPVVTSKVTSGRPLLIDSALPTEFRATHSKQTTEEFLTGARTHIRIFNFSPFPTQNPAQLIQRRRHLTNPTRSNRRRKPYQIPKTVTPKNLTAVSLFLLRRFTRASFRFDARQLPTTVTVIGFLTETALQTEPAETKRLKSV